MTIKEQDDIISWLRQCKEMDLKVLTRAEQTILALDDERKKKDLLIGELGANANRYRAPLEQFMKQWESDIQFYNGLDGADLATWAEMFRNALASDS